MKIFIVNTFCIGITHYICDSSWKICSFSLKDIFDLKLLMWTFHNDLLYNLHYFFAIIAIALFISLWSIKHFSLEVYTFQ